MTSSVEHGQRHKRSHPCPVCEGYDEAPRGQGKRCSGFTNGDWCRCTREEFAGSLDVEIIGGVACFRHFLAGACRCGVQHGPARPRTDDVEATYDYVDEAGKLLYQVVRRVGKRFTQRKPDGAGGWDWKLGDVRRVPYRLDKLVREPKSTPLHIVEGEKDVESLERAGLLATTNAGGAGKWASCHPAAVPVITGRQVVIISDTDEPGRKHAQQVAAALRSLASSLTVLEPPHPHKDITDAIRAGLTVADCVPVDAPALRVVQPATPPWDDTEDPSGARAPEGDTRSELRITSDIAKNVNALDEALGTHEAGVYQRSGSLVQVVANAEPGGIATGTPLIHELTSHALAYLVTKHFRCVRWKAPDKGAIRLEATGGPKAQGEWLPAQPPDKGMLLPMLHVANWKHVRPIRAVTVAPMLRPDGSVVQTPGYDASTGWLYAPECEYPAIPENPTRNDATTALGLLRHVFCDFPYDSPASAIVPIAALLTIVGRSAILGPTPAFLFDASVRGSGKTLQGDVIHAVATGRPAQHSTFPDRPEEQEKTITTYALKAAPIAFFDNVKGSLGGPMLEMVTTSSSISFRILGTMQMARLDWTTVVLVSGNNLALTDDMVRRSFMSRLEPHDEHPEKRTGFAHPDLVGWVTDERPRILAAALTLLRAYCAAGRPDPVTMQSFISWSHLVPSAIRWAGGGDTLEARAKNVGSGIDEVAAVGVVLQHIPRLMRDTQDVQAEAISTKAMLDAIYPAPRRDEPPDGYDELREALESLAPPRGGLVDSTRLGKALAKYIGRWVSGRKLVSVIGAGVRKWRVESK